jgi:alpha-L-fucosidase
LAGKIEYAQLLNDGSEINFRDADVNPNWSENDLKSGFVELTLPVIKPDVVVPVVELFLRA